MSTVKIRARSQICNGEGKNPVGGAREGKDSAMLVRETFALLQC